MTTAAWGTAWGPEQHAWRDADRRYALPLCAAISVLAHVLVLMYRDAPEPARLAGAAPSAAMSRAVQVRMVSPRVEAAMPPTAREAPSAPRIAEHVRSPSAPRSAPAAHATAIVAAAKTAASPASATSAASAASVSPPEPVTQASVPTQDAEIQAQGVESTPMPTGQDEYIPRPLLSVAPVAQTPVLLAAPPGETEIARRAGVLALYIDEEGAVRQVTADPDSALPPAYEQAARQAFMAARFAPGEVDGVAVKSRIHVEVVFDNTPLVDE